MAINLSQSFTRTSGDPIDNTQVLTKAEMLGIDDGLMPDNYFAVCKDDGKFYVYDKSATPNAQTGKFVEVGVGDLLDKNIPHPATIAYPFGLTMYDTQYGTLDPEKYPKGYIIYNSWSEKINEVANYDYTPLFLVLTKNDGTKVVCEHDGTKCGRTYEEAYGYGGNEYNIVFKDVTNANNVFAINLNHPIIDGNQTLSINLLSLNQETGRFGVIPPYTCIEFKFYEKRYIRKVSHFVDEDFDLDIIGELNITEAEINETFSRVYGEGALTQEHYSVGEEVLIGTWKENGVTYDLYRKVIDFGAIPSSTVREVAHGITNYHRFVTIRAISYDGTDVFEMPYAHPESAYAVGVFVRTANNTVVLTTGTARSGYKAMAIIEFTRARG